MPKKNLKNHDYADRYLINIAIDAWTQKSQENADTLCFGVLASALQGDKTRYSRIIPLAKKAIKAMPDNSHKACLLGRILYAADRFDEGDKSDPESKKDKDQKTVKETTSTLKTLLKKISEDDTDAATAWCYLGSISFEEYNLAKEEMIATAWKVTAKFNEAEYDKSKPQLEEKKSNALWCWVMVARVSSKNLDSKIFEYALMQIKNISGEPSVALALSKKLKNNAAWALGMMTYSSINFWPLKQQKYMDLYSELKGVLEDSVKKAKESDAVADATLGRLYSALGTFYVEDLNKREVMQDVHERKDVGITL